MSRSAAVGDGDSVEPRLIDGSAPRSPEQLYRMLDALGVDYRVLEHQPVRTVDEARTIRGDLEQGAHVKNLFLRDRPGRMWLLTVERDLELDLKGLREPLGARGSLSFGSRRRLMERLGLEPGAVSPLAIVNDVEGVVQVVLDEALARAPLVHLHPLRNHLTVSLAPADLERFLVAQGHGIVWMKRT